jgi:hypothetical protein
MFGKFVGVLFFGVFAAVGIFMLVFKAGPMVIDWAAMQSWQPVQARLVDYNLGQGSVQGATTYQAKAKYEYYYNDKQYTAKRVSIDSGSDNIGSYHEDMYRKLSRVGNKPMTIWVNPNDPNQAIVYRGFRYGKFLFFLFFVLIFGGIGIGGIVLVWKNADAGEKLADADVEKPWTEYAEWLDPVKQDQQKAANYVGLGFATFWIAMTAGGFFAAIQERWLYGFVMLPFLIVGGYLLHKCVESIKAYRQTGKMPLSLDPYPGSINGQIGGVIYIDKRFTTAPSKTEIEVQCIRKRRRRNDDETREKKVWYQVAPFDWQMGEHGWQLRFCFDIPADQEISSAPLTSNGIEWRVKLNAQTVGGVDFERSYNDIPVFATAANSSFSDHISNKVAASIAAQHESLVVDILDLKLDNRGYRLFYPMFRNWFGAIFASIGLGFTIAGYYIPDIIFNIVFPLLGIPCFLAGVYSLGNSLDVRIGAEGISSQRKLYGISFKPKFLASYEYEKFKKKQSHSSSQGNETTEYFSIVAIGKNRQKVTVAVDIEGRKGALAAIEKLQHVVKELGYA